MFRVLGATSSRGRSQRRTPPRLRAVLDVRSFATAVTADEVADHPEFVAGYARAFADADDATLVIYDTDDDPDGLAQRLAPFLAQAGLDVQERPDVLALSTPAKGDWVLAARLDAVLSRRLPSGPMADLPRYDDSTLGELRGLATAPWPARAA